PGVQRVRRDLERPGQIPQDLSRWLADPPFDLAQIGIGDPCLLRQSTQREIGPLTLGADELTQVRVLALVHYPQAYSKRLLMQAVGRPFANGLWSAREDLAEEIAQIERPDTAETRDHQVLQPRPDHTVPAHPGLDDPDQEEADGGEDRRPHGCGEHVRGDGVREDHGYRPGQEEESRRRHRLVGGPALLVDESELQG